jgi:hypothetical protein
MVPVQAAFERCGTAGLSQSTPILLILGYDRFHSSSREVVPMHVSDAPNASHESHGGRPKGVLASQLAASA